MTRRALGIAGLLVLLVVLALVPAARAQLGPNIVVNGSFELPTVCPAPFATHTQGSTAITGWTVEDGGVSDALLGSVDHVGSYWQAHDACQSIDLNGLSPGALRQDVATPGEEYLLSFWMAGNPDSPPAVKTMDVEWGGTVVYSPSFTTDLSNPLLTRTSNMGWTYHEVTVEATSATTTLRFISTTNTGPCPCYGPALDDVALQEIDDDDDDGEDDDEDGEDEDGDGDDDDGDDDDDDDNDDG